jgi:hypothetical protein
MTLRSGGKTTTIKTSKTRKDECYKLEWRERKEVHVRIEIEELGDEMAQLQIESAQGEEVPGGLTDKLKRLTIKVDIQAPWVKAWGRNRKVAKRSKFGVNTPPLYRWQTSLYEYVPYFNQNYRI